MGIFLNRGNRSFDESVHATVYVDKTDMIAILNERINTEDRYICVSRPRRFGKTMTAAMLNAYYDKSANSRYLFENRKLGSLPDWDRYLNKYDVIRIDVAGMKDYSDSSEEALDKIKKYILTDLDKAYPGIFDPADTSVGVGEALVYIHDRTNAKFVFIIDEWDVFFRDDNANSIVQEKYIQLLRTLFKGDLSKDFTALAYLTGILPIKKYNSESALNNFTEFTMLDPLVFSKYVGFTAEEVEELCRKYGADMDALKNWYDGYSFSDIDHIYSPNSVAKAITNKKCLYYWYATASVRSLEFYITMNFDGLKEAIITLVGGGRQQIGISLFQNDTKSLKTKDDVMTLLIHLGYLSYDPQTQEVRIPNREAMYFFENAILSAKWNEVIQSIND